MGKVTLQSLVLQGLNRYIFGFKNLWRFEHEIIGIYCSEL